MKLGDIVSLVRGNTYKSSLLAETGGPVLLGLGSIDRDGGYKRGSWKHYLGPLDPNILLYPGDLYVSLKDLTQKCDLLGSIARVPDEVSEGRLTQDTVKLVFPDNSAVKDQQYVYWGLRTPQYRAYCKARGIGTTNMSLSRKDFLAWELPAKTPQNDRLINLFEQIDKKIAVNCRINDYLAELCELIVSRSEATDGALSDICTQVTDKVSCTEAQIDSYVSTESLLADKNGRQLAASVPQTGKVVVYKAGDTLVSNIRPYFKKIWFAENDGTCSGDVVVFRANNPSLAPYLYAILRSDKFFDYVMSGAKGTKMPRGDKKQMMSYGINPYCPERDLEIIAFAVYGIGASNQENQYLSSLRDSLLPKLMSGEIDTSKVELPTLPNNHLCAG